MRKRIFISYTLRDGFVNKNILRRLKLDFEKIGDTFIDVLDNDSELKQERVILELNKADMFIMITTPEFFNSPWVKQEIDIAKERQIPMYKIQIEDIEKITPHNYIQNEIDIKFSAGYF